MPIDRTRIDRISDLFSTAARTNALVTFRELFAIFPQEAPAADVYDTLEAACARIADRDHAIYEALLAKRDTGMPGSGFFDQFRNLRSDEYEAIAGRTEVPDLAQEQQCAMVARERSRVYEHAAQQLDNE